jgi:hypothetical protein
VEDVIDTARLGPEFRILPTANIYGAPKDMVKLTHYYSPQLDAFEKRTLNHVIRTTSGKDWDEFIRLVYSTYPVMTQPRYTYLDLPRLARQYRKVVSRAEQA